MPPSVFMTWSSHSMLMTQRGHYIACSKHLTHPCMNPSLATNALRSSTSS